MIFFREQGLEIKEAVDRKGFEEAIQGYIAKIAACIDETIQKAGLRPEDIDVVFTTGGTSHIPCVKDLFVQRFGQEKMQQREADRNILPQDPLLQGEGPGERMGPFTSVACGLGLSASMFYI